MNIRFKEIFLKDLHQVRDKELLGRLKTLIESVERAQAPDEIPHLKPLKGWKRYYRIRMGDYRIGLIR